MNRIIKVGKLNVPGYAIKQSVVSIDGISECLTAGMGMGGVSFPGSKLKKAIS